RRPSQTLNTDSLSPSDGTESRGPTGVDPEYLWWSSRKLAVAVLALVVDSLLSFHPRVSPMIEWKSSSSLLGEVACGKDGRPSSRRLCCRDLTMSSWTMSSNPLPNSMTEAFFPCTTKLPVPRVNWPSVPCSSTATPSTSLPFLLRWWEK